jgi:hypothetical protein
VLFKRLVNLGCDINGINASGLHPIHAAILFRRPASLKLVMDLGASPDLKTGPEVRFNAKLRNLDATAYLATLCAKDRTNCDELHAILTRAGR